MAVLHASALVAAHSVSSHGGELGRRRRDEQLRGLVEADAQGVHPSDACLHQPQLCELCNQKPATKVHLFGTRLEEGRVPIARAADGPYLQQVRLNGRSAAIRLQPVCPPASGSLLAHEGRARRRLAHLCDTSQQQLSEK
jgi:hypothetical protein